MRRHYHRECLKHHPDKGGDVARFNVVYDTFETLRAMVEEGKVTSFTVGASETPTRAPPPPTTTKQRKGGKAPAAAEPRRHPSYGYFQEAMDAGVALYVIELAKSGRATCAKGEKCCRPIEFDDATSTPKTKVETTTKRGRKVKASDANAVSASARDLERIAKGAVRIGVIDGISGKYARFCHLKCWRIPSLIWKGLPQPGSADFSDIDAFVRALRSMNEVVFTGFASLPERKQREVAEWCMDATHWAKARKTKKLAGGAKIEVKVEEDDVDLNVKDDDVALVHVPPKKAKKSKAGMTLTATAATAIVAKPSPAGCIIPVPGHDGAVANVFAQKTCVMTGVFPELGGGMGLNLGKDRMRQVIERFGGRVTSAISGKTDILIVGREPGATKTETARQRNLQLLSFENTMDVIHGRYIEGEKPLVIDKFSAGWGGSGKIYSWDQKRLDAAAGVSQKVTKDEVLALPSSAPAKTGPSSAKVKKAAHAVSKTSRGKKRIRSVA